MPYVKDSKIPDTDAIFWKFQIYGINTNGSICAIAGQFKRNNSNINGGLTAASVNRVILKTKLGSRCIRERVGS